MMNMAASFDTVCLFASLLLLFAYLKRWVPVSYAVIGILMYGAMLPLTYLFHQFQPWDRPSIVLWILLLMLIRAGPIWVIAPVLAVSAGIKYDTVLLPGLYWLV
jgi:hypothetical protein